MLIFERKEDIFELLQKFEKSSLTEIDINIAGNVRLSMKKQGATAPAPYFMPFAPQSAAGGGISVYHENQAADIPEQMQKQEDAVNATDGKIITAPLIGTYYSAPSPDSETFVQVGSTITKGSILCIIEAMKVMNEIESEIVGEIAEIFVENGESVEYGQPLFRIK